MRYLTSLVIFLFLIPVESKCLSQSPAANEHELIFIFNQPKYSSGDTAFFAASLHGFSSQISSGKRVIGVSLVDSQNAILYYNRTIFQDGTGYGQLILPKDLPSGAYWMMAEIEGLNSNEIFKSPFIVSGKFSYPSFHEDRLDLIQGNFSTDPKTPGRRHSIKVKLAPAENIGVDDDMTVSVFKESLFPVKEQGQSTILKLVSTGDMQEDGLNKKSNPYFFKGTAVFSNSKNVPPDSTQLVFYLNRNDFIFQVFTNSRGEFSFPLFKNFSNEEVFYSAFVKGVKVDSIVLDIKDFQYTGEKINVDPSKIPDPFFQYQEKLKSIEDSYRYFANNQKVNTVENSDWWPEVDYEVNLEKLEPFITMEEVFQNVISLVRYKKSPDGDGVRVFLKKITEYATKDPIFIIDGTMTDNVHYFVNLDPVLVKRIGICRTPEILGRYGLLGENGIIVVETTNKSLPWNARTGNSFLVTGISNGMEFHESKIQQNNRVPIFKPCLYWNPKLVRNETGGYEFQFNTSDDLGYFIIQFTSKDKTGRIYSRQERIQIVP